VRRPADCCSGRHLYWSGFAAGAAAASAAVSSSKGEGAPLKVIFNLLDKNKIEHTQRS